MRAKLRDVAEAASLDPKKALLDSLDGRFHGIHMCRSLLLVATYIEPDTTPGGIIKPDRTLAENRFQGKVGLVLKLGPLAFHDDDRVKFGGLAPQEMDWVLVRPSDGIEIFSVDATGRAGTSCRIFSDTDIKARLDDPALVY